MVVPTTLTVNIDAASVLDLGESSYVLRVGLRPDAADPFNLPTTYITTDPPNPTITPQDIGDKSFILHFDLPDLPDTSGLRYFLGYYVKGNKTDIQSIKEIKFGGLYELPKEHGFGIKNNISASINLYSSNSTDENFVPGTNASPVRKYHLWVPGTGKLEPLGSTNKIIAWFENLNLSPGDEEFAAADQSAKFPINYAKGDNNAKTVNIPAVWNVAAAR